MYVPSNPFHAMANAIVPGVVLISTALGLALIGVAGKETLLASLRALEQAVVRVTRFALTLTPIGVFAITASIAGTMGPQALVRLEVYFVVFALASLLLCSVVLPLAVVTPFSYREVVTIGKDALITAFIASSTFIVLPMVVECVKAMLATHAIASTVAQSSVDVVVPISLVVPNAGKPLTLMFVPYAAWLGGIRWRPAATPPCSPPACRATSPRLRATATAARG
jgi:Na+/H+-dicarboxylate symporter